MRVSSQTGQRIGDWLLGEQLGRGGNATVWSATRSEDDPPVALKIINTKKIDREPYQRFIREIRFLREHETVQGLLPVVDAHLPERPTRSDRPWLAMPIATPIAQALEDRPLIDVVSAVAAIADTLWRLQRDHDVAHRDIKPGNLYELNGEWLLGDFGLVALPDADGLTAQGRPLGPAHYMPYEMILDPASADAHAADVYSLGKTLWVLATAQRFPPEGHQPADVRGFGVRDFQAHHGAGAIDQEIDVMTRLQPENRPSKEQVATDLRAWGDLADEPVVLDVSDARLRLQEKLRSQLDAQDVQAHRKELAFAAVRRLQELTKPLNESLKQLSTRTEVDSSTDKMTTNLLKSHGWGSRVVFRWHRCTLVAPLDRPASMVLRMGRSLELMEDGTLRLHLMVHVGPEGVLATNYTWQPSVTSAVVGTVEAQSMLESGVNGLVEALREGIDVFVESLPDLKGSGS